MTIDIRWFILGVLVVGGLGFSLLYKPCVQPVEIEIKLAQFRCLMNSSKEEIADLRAEICKSLNKEADCDLSREDFNSIRSIFARHNDKCIKNVLEKQNLCTDKVKSVEEMM